MSKEKKRLEKMRDRILGKSEQVKNTPTPRQELTKDSDYDKYGPITFTIRRKENKILNEWMGHIHGVYGSLLIARASSGLQVSRGLIWRSTS